MAFTEALICNIALERIGAAKRISILETERSAEAQACRLHFEPTRDMVLEDFPWPFAAKYELLGLIEEDPNLEWSFSYRIPVDYISARYLVTASGLPTSGRSPIPSTLLAEQPRIAFSIGHDDNGLILLTNERDALLKYTSRFEDVTRFSPSFGDAFSWRLAVEIAMPLAVQPTFRERAERFYLRSVAQAQANAVNAEQKPAPPDGGMISSRD